MGAGSVSESYAFPSLPARGGPLALELRYSTSNDTPVALARVPFTITSQMPARAIWRIDFQGRVYSGEGYDAEAMIDTRNALGERVAPGPYPFTATETFFYDSGAQPSLRAQGTVEVRRGDIWPFGFGWMSTYDTLLVDRTTTVTVIQGDGQYLTYNRDANSRYVPAAEDFSTLVRFADGSWLRTAPDGLRQWFSPTGRLLRLEDRNGNDQTLSYEPSLNPPPAGVWGLSERLSGITDASGRSYAFHYGPGGTIDRVTDAAGRAFTLSHDAAGNLTAITDPLGRVTAYEYDANHLLTRVIQPKGDDVRLTYDDRRRVLSHTDALGGVRSGQYQPSRNTFTDERGNPTTYLFNSYAAVTQWRNPVQTVNYLWNDKRQLLGTDAPYRRLAYDARGNLVEDNGAISLRWTYEPVFNQTASFTDGARHTTTYTYDARGNRVQTTDAAGHVSRAAYDAYGQVVQLTDPLNQTVSFDYDAFGNPTRITDARGFVQQMSYDARGNLTRATDAENHANTFTYDVMDRMTAKTDALGRTTRFEYDANDNLTKATDPRGNASTLGYDALDRPTAETDPLNRTTHYEYDAVGNLTKVIDAAGNSVAYTYDAGNRHLSESDSGGGSASYTYNAISDLLAYEDALTRATYVYTNAIPHKPDAVTTQLLASGITSTVDYDYVVAVGTAPASAQADTAGAGDVATTPAADAAPNPAPDPMSRPAPDHPPGNPLPDPVSPPSAADPDHTPRSEPDPLSPPSLAGDDRPAGQDRRPAGQPYTARPAKTATDVCGTISANTTWNLAGSPYRVTCDITVNAGVTLTLDPGVVVKFNSFWDTLWVHGTLIADGTAGQPITFTSIKDDAAGGDTNGDGNATQPAGNDWDSLRFQGTSTGSVLDHAIVRYGGGDWYESLYAATRDITLTNNTIAYSGQEGIRFDSVLPAVFTGNSFLNNAGLPVWAPLNNNSHSLVISGNTASGQAVNGFAVAGSIAGNVTWDGDDGFPFVVWDDLTVNQGAKLSLTPGTVMKFNDFHDTLWVHGTLIAGGEQAQPITFTSIKDDAVGGDTNGNATQPGPNDWDSLRFQGTSTGSVLDHAIVRYGGGEWYESLYAATRDITLTNNTIAYSGQEGIRFDSVLPAVFTGNSFLNNAGLPVWAPLNNNSHSLVISGNTASGQAVNGFAVAGSIAGNVTWDGDDGFPFVVWDDLTVNQGAKLTLTPGTVMKFNDFHDTLWVQGTLIAGGEQAQPITFTSIKDDTVGGDTNGSAAQPRPNDWDSLRFQGTSTGSVLDHAIVRYGGGDWYESLYTATRDITLTNNTIAYSGESGIRLDNVFPARLEGNRFADNVGAAVWWDLNGNANAAALSGNTASGNLVNGLALKGSVGGDVTWDGDDGFPFIVWDDLTINAGAKLTLAPGTVLKFKDFYDTLWVQGTLIADGEQERPITFTSIKDDTAGGDTNGDGGGSGPAPNEWDSLRFQPGSTANVLDHAAIRYGGGDWYEEVYVATNGITIENSAITLSGEHGIRIDGASPTLTGNTIRDHAASGVLTQNGARPLLRQNRIIGNDGYGVFNQDGSVTVDAEDNWWGSVKGPYDPSDDSSSGGLYNPKGDGDKVSDKVDYQPWLAFTGLLYGITVATGANPVQTVRFGYDDLNRVAELNASGPVQTAYRYSYDAAGRLTSSGPAAGSPGLAAMMEYDANARLTRLIDRNPSGSVTFDDIRYTYDKVGNVLTAQDANGTTTYTYDAASQLTAVSGPGLSQTYAYDAAGNRTGKGALSYTYDAANQLLSSSDGWNFTYDANGNLQARARSSQTTTYTWDVRDRLTRIDYPDGSFSAFAYDAQGRRISRRDRQGATTYFIYEGWNLMQEVAANGAVLANYVYDGLDHLIAMNRGGATYYYRYDREGNVTGLTNGAGVLVASYRYDPWGNLIATGGSNPTLTNPFRFAGREWDADSGLYYLRARYYDPDLGRFLSRDPLHLTMPGANHYLYAANNPANAGDPMGLDVGNRRWWQTLGGIAVGVGAGIAFIATAPVSGPLALAAGATVVGGLAGGSAAAGSELVFADKCDRDLWAAFVAGGKGGLVGGAASPYVIYVGGQVASSVSTWASTVGGTGSGMGAGVQSVAAQRLSIELQMSAARRMMNMALSKGDWLLYERWNTKLELLQAALGKLPIW